MKRFGIPMALLGVVAWCVPAMAQQSSSQYRQNQQQGRQWSMQQDRQQSNMRQSQMRQGQGQQLAVRGKLMDARRVNIRGEQQPHVLGKLQTNSGRTIVVDLGTANEIRRMNLVRGEEIMVQGRSGRVNGRPVLVADRVRDQDMIVTLVRVVPVSPERQAMQQANRYGQQQRQQFGQNQQRFGQNQQRLSQNQQRFAQNQQQQRRMQQQQSQMQRPALALVRGTVVQTREVNLGDQQGKHMLAKIRMPNDRMVVIDLGRRDQLKDIQLSNGEMIAAIGSPGRINGRPVLMADHVADLVTIERDRGNAQQAGQKQGPTTRPQQQKQRQQSSQQRNQSNGSN